MRQPYLQLVTPTSVTVVWRTDLNSADNSRVQYGTVSGSPNQTATSTAITRSGLNVKDHIVTIAGLNTATKYFYNVGTGTDGVQGGGTNQHFFVTSPPTGSSTAFRAWVLGDSGFGSADQALVRDSMLTETTLNPPSPNLILHMGDIAYNNGTESEFTNYHFAVYQNILRHTPLWPTLGNHEAVSVNTAMGIGPYYEAHVLPANGQAGGVASGTEAYYAFDYANAHFIVLDSMDSSRVPGSSMLTWLQNDLASTGQEWVIAYWHHPPYSKGFHDSDNSVDSGGRLRDMRETVLPILEAGGVDLVIAGHSHVYERSYLINEAYGYGTSPNFATPSFSTLLADGHILDAGDGNPSGNGAYQKHSGGTSHDGTVYVVAGHGGNQLDTNAPGNHPVMPVFDLAFGSVLLDINGSSLTGRNLRSGGAITDTFVIAKSPVHLLTVTKSGTGSGTVTSVPAGIDCGATCAASFASGTVVDLTAVANGSATFGGWSGNADCTDGQVTLTGAVSCTATFTASGGGGLLTDDFNDGNFAGWQVVDEGTVSAPSAWAVVSGALRQSSNIQDGDTAVATLPKKGTFAWYPNGIGWSNYQLAVQWRSTDDDALGVMVRYQNPNNYYRFSWDAQRTYRRLVKVVNGSFTLLAQEAVPYVTGQTYQVAVVANGNALEVRVDGVTRFGGPIVDGALATGSVGLYAWGNATSIFDTVQVTALGGGGGSQTLTVTKSGTGSGTVTSVPAGIDCGATCAASFASGTVVDLTAVANGSATFGGWSGNADCTDGQVTLTGAVSCTATFTASGGGGLLTDDFNDGNFAGWQVVDEGTVSAPSAWAVVSGALRQSSNIQDGDTAVATLPKKGTFAWYPNGIGWSNYQLAVQWRSTDDDALGVMVRYQNPNNYYRFSWDAQRTYRRLVKVVNGSFTLLAQEAVPYVTGQTYQVAVVANGTSLEVRVDGVTRFGGPIVDGALATGSVGLYAWGNATSIFDTVQVTALGGGGGSQTLTVTKSGTGSGTVTSVPAGIDCGATCAASFASGTVVDLTAVANGSATFGGWSGNADCTDGQVTLTGAVSCTATFTVSGGGGLLADDFNDGNFAGWQVVDEGTVSAPSAWAVVSGALRQSSNIQDGDTAVATLPKKGTFAWYPNGIGWSNYQLAVQWRSTDDDALGVMVRYQNPNNYYRFSWDAQRTYRRLVKVVNGSFTLLAQEAVPYVTGQTYQVAVVANGTSLEVRVDGVTRFGGPIVDGALATGSVGLYAWGNATSIFDTVQVTALGGGGL